MDNATWKSDRSNYLKEIATAMGSSWAGRVRTLPGGELETSGGWLNEESGAGFFLWGTSQGNGDKRIEVIPQWPTDSTGFEHRPGTYDKSPGRITISAMKTPAQAAKDIMRRSCPDYLPIYRERRAISDKCDQVRLEREERAKAAAQAVETTTKAERYQFTDKDPKDPLVYFDATGPGFKIRCHANYDGEIVLDGTFSDELFQKLARVMLEHKE